MNEGIQSLLKHPVFLDRPPVCVDLGATGELPELWSSLAEVSVCIAFDADEREFAAEESTGGPWRRLIKINRLVQSESLDASDFFLTRSPQCSSSLEPDAAALQSWDFAALFDVIRRTKLPSVTLADSLRALGIEYIDWFKADTQGTDLRLFAGLPKAIADRVMAVDFEPGIIDAYQGEDKLHHVLSYMEARPFFVCDLLVKGTRRIDQRTLGTIKQNEREISGRLKSSPCWAEISYLSDFTRSEFSLRDALLMWVIATLKQQHGHAAFIATRAKERFPDEELLICEAESLKAIIKDDACDSRFRRWKRRLASRLPFIHSNANREGC